MHDKELRACGVGHHRTRHREHTLCVLKFVLEAVHRKLTLDAVTGTAHTCSVGTAALNHEAVDYAVESQAVIKSVVYKADEVVDRVRRDFWIKLSLDELAAVHFECNNGI